ncbi:hypothetical protein FHX37_3543 [Haloactinospora alba]|uniref:Uncharacterized protein n=2 Tax=Haloactinospora alba TaxID=405555 RepID=A0A543NNW1_9ACTN|nr:hypothetical protein FHX37_3543 [Haloactinospora alba]
MDRRRLAGVTPGETGRRLRVLWCHHSRRQGWGPLDGWWTPAVDAVCTAAAVGGDMAEGCERFGQARARSGVSLGATLDDFAALANVLGWNAPPTELVKALAEGWVDGGSTPDYCQDPLTGLATATYLRTRLSELYRSTVARPPSAMAHRLLLITLDPTIDPWRRTARLIVLGHELRRFFTQGESLALISRHRIAALVPETADPHGQARLLRDDVCDFHGADVWTVPLPDGYQEALVFLEEPQTPGGPG